MEAEPGTNNPAPEPTEDENRVALEEILFQFKAAIEHLGERVSGIEAFLTEATKPKPILAPSIKSRPKTS